MMLRGMLRMAILSAFAFSNAFAAGVQSANVLYAWPGSDALFDPTRIGSTVEAAGVVRFALRDGASNLVLRVRSPSAHFLVTCRDGGLYAPADLEDAGIIVRGRLEPLTMPDGRIIGANVVVEGPAGLNIARPAPKGDGIPLVSVADLRTARDPTSRLHRYRVCGVVSFTRTCDNFFFLRQQDGRTLRVGTRIRSAAKIGDIVEATGFLTLEAGTPCFEDSSVRILGRDASLVPRPVAAKIADIAQNAPRAGGEDWFGEIVSVEGVVRDVNRRETMLHLLLRDGDHSLQIRIPHRRSQPLPDGLELNARVRVEGIVTMEYALAPYHNTYKVENLCVNTTWIGSVAVIREAPWWTPGRLALLLGAVLVVLAAVLAWSMYLRSDVRRQKRNLARTLREKERQRIEADAARRERLQLSCDLHDDFQQLLAGAMFHLEAAYNYLPETADAARRELDSLGIALNHTQEGLRSSLWSMTQESEGPTSLSALFRFAAKRLPQWKGKIDFEFSGRERPLVRRHTGALLLILQEAVGNALRHGSAEHVNISVEFGENAVSMTITDDGSGFDANAVETGLLGTGLGLRSMRDRALGMGGSFEVKSSPGKGATVAITVPYGQQSGDDGTVRGSI